MTGRWHRVRVHWPDGRTHDDAIRGRTAGEAIDNAIANWITETPYAQADRVEYLHSGLEPKFTGRDHGPTTTWSGCTHGRISLAAMHRKARCGGTGPRRCSVPLNLTSPVLGRGRW